jgi:hypothetical protein
LAVFVLLPIVFISGTAFALALVYFLDSRRTASPIEEPLAKAEQQDGATKKQLTPKQDSSPNLKDQFPSKDQTSPKDQLPKAVSKVPLDDVDLAKTKPVVGDGPTPAAPKGDGAVASEPEPKQSPKEKKPIEVAKEKEPAQEKTPGKKGTIVGTVTKVHSTTHDWLIVLDEKEGQTQVFAIQSKVAAAEKDALKLLREQFKKLKVGARVEIDWNDEQVYSPENKKVPGLNVVALRTAKEEKSGPVVEKEPMPKDKIGKKDLPAEIKAHVAKLRTGSNQEKIAAAEALAAKGEGARGASAALCEATISPVKDVSRAALQALEKVQPDLYEPVFTLLVDGQAANHRKAIAALRKHPEKAKPAMVVLLGNTRKCLTDFDQQMRTRQGSIGWASKTLQDVTIDLLRSLPEIAPEDPEGAFLISQAAAMKQLDFSGRPIAIAGPFRHASVPLLGTLAEKRPEFRKQITQVLAPLLDESVTRFADHSNKNASIQALRSDIAEIEAVGDSLLQCGPDASETFRKRLIAVCKELEFHDNATVRSDAKALRQRLEAQGKLDAGALSKTGTLEQGEEKAFPFKMTAGKVYVIDLVSTDFDAYLKLKSPAGLTVAEDDDSGGGLNARIMFSCSEPGTYRILASSLGKDGSGTFKLTVREK